MKKHIYKYILTAFAIWLAAIFFAACAKPPQSLPQSSSAPQSAAVQLTPLQENIAKYLLLTQSQPSAENYRTLAGFYAEAGQIKQQRDVLEQGWRLNQDAESFDILQNIVVNAKEESPYLQGEIMRLEQNLSIEEYRAEALAMLISPEWFKNLMPKMPEGKRNYYWQSEESQNTLILELGYNKENLNLPYTKAWYISEGGAKVQVLLQEDAVFQMMETGLANGQYSGAFSSWLCISSTGGVYNDTGNFENGVLVGDFASRTHSINAPTDLFSLFSSKDGLEFANFAGNFAQGGKATVPQPAQSDGSFVAYAYSEDGKDYLKYNMAQDVAAADFVFDSMFYGINAPLAFAPYTPAPNAPAQGQVSIDISNMQVRVYDSVLEWFDGSTWHQLGSVEEYLVADPFYAPSLPQTGQTGEAGQAEIRHSSGFTARRAAAQIEAEKPKPATSSAAQSKPRTASSAAPAPSPPASQAPAQPPPPPAPSSQAPAPPPPAPSSQAPAPPPPTTGDGQDIGWSGDIL